MQTEGIVTEIISEKYAKVCLHARGGCQSCESKDSCLADKEKKMKHVTAINETGAEVGNSIIMESNPWSVVFSAFLVYIFPLILLFAGYFIGKILLPSEQWAIAASLTGLVMGFLILRSLNKTFAKMDAYKPKIVKIVYEE